MTASSDPTPRARRAARLIVTDVENRVLLFQIARHDGSRFWATPGGGLEEGETFEEAARRESIEELDHEITELGPPLWRGSARFTFATLGDSPILQEEVFFRVEVESWQPSARVASFHEEEGILEGRFFSLAELEAREAEVFPEGLVEKLRERGIV